MPRLLWLTVPDSLALVIVTLTERPLLLMTTDLIVVGVTVPTMNRVGPLPYRTTLMCLLPSLPAIVRMCELCTLTYVLTGLAWALPVCMVTPVWLFGLCV